MQTNLLKFTICPECKFSDLELVSSEENDIEIRSGQLFCKNCNSIFTLVEGVAELLPLRLDEDTVRERMARSSKPRNWEIERQRPFIQDNLDQPWIWPSFAANVIQGIEQIQLNSSFVLDLGPATCWSTRMLTEKGAKAVAMDISTEMLKDGEAQFAKDIYFDRVAATMQEIPFKDSTFDVVFASACIHHASDLNQAFREIARVLKPGGKVIMVNEPVAGFLTKVKDFGREEKEHGMNEHIYRLKDYLLAAQKNGLPTKILFPSSLEKQIKGRIPASSNRIKMFRLLGAVMTPKLLYLTLLPAHKLIGISLVLVASKQA